MVNPKWFVGFTTFSRCCHRIPGLDRGKLGVDAQNVPDWISKATSKKDRTMIPTTVIYFIGLYMP